MSAVMAATFAVASGIAGVAVAGDVVPYTCPANVSLETSPLCGDGSSIAVIRQPGGVVQFLHFLQKKILAAQEQDGTLRAPIAAPERMVGRLSELDAVVRPMRSFRNVFVLRFRRGLATQRRLDRLTFELCDLLRNAHLEGGGGCKESRSTVHLEPAFKLHADAAPPNDPNFLNSEPSQWNLQDDEGIKAHAAWDRAGTVPGLQAVRVAVLDTGTKEIANELDNGLLVDGADFTQQTPVIGNPPAGKDHGTEVASVIAARANNNNAMAGVAWSGSGQGSVATLVPIKIMSSASPSEFEQCTNNLLDALPYAVDPDGEADAGNSGGTSFWDLSAPPDPHTNPIRPARGARVVNLSVSYDNCSAALGETFSRISRFFPDVLFVVSVPNTNGVVVTANIDDTPPNPSFPTSYRINNILSVTGTDLDRCVTGKFGKTSVNIAAPGEGVVVLQQSHAGAQTDSGTSFAAPQVSGAAALLKALAPSTWQYAQVRRYLMDSADHSMCDNSGPILGCLDAPNYATICHGVASGLLDLDAATAPPVMQISAFDNSDAANTWSTAKAAMVNWEWKFDSTLCQQVDIDLVIDQNDHPTTTKAAKLSATPVDVTVHAVQFDATTIAAAATAAMPPATESATARVRLQCVGSHMFRTSQDFTIRRSD